MKRLAFVLSIITLLTIFSPGFSIFAQPTLTPHENPAMAESSSDPTTLLLTYVNVFDLAAIRQYQDAQSLLSELEKTSIPDEIRYIDRFNAPSHQLFNTLNNVEFFLDEASTLFANNQFSDAKEKLDSAEATIREAQFLQEDITAPTTKLPDNLAVLADPAQSQVKQAYDHLKESLDQLRQLTNELNQLREKLELNPQMIIETNFYHSTLLEVFVPETAYPGLPITITGQVSSPGSNVYRTIEVLLDNTQLTEETIQGKFSFKITPPPQISTGKHGLTIVATPQGRYLGTSKRLSIYISRIPIQTDIQVPQLVILSQPIQVSGKVYHNLSPIQDAIVSLAFRQSSTTAKTTTDGSFTAAVKPPQLSILTTTSSNFFYATTTTITLPFDLSLVGPQEITANITPVEPWYAPLQIKRWIFTVNPLNIGLMLVVFLSFGLLVYNRVKTRPSALREEKLIPPLLAQELPPVTPPPEPKYEFTGIKGSILSAYISGLEVVEKITGIPMAAPTTLREFLKIAALRLPTVSQPFTELTIIAEVALYSVHRLDEDTATRAEQLANTIKEELYSEPA